LATQKLAAGVAAQSLAPRHWTHLPVPVSQTARAESFSTWHSVFDAQAAHAPFAPQIGLSAGQLAFERH
jgi:hypothetical protein